MPVIPTFSANKDATRRELFFKIFNLLYQMGATAPKTLIFNDTIANQLTNSNSAVTYS